MICTYQDYSEEEEIETNVLAPEKMDQDGNEQIVFPVKLHNMLNQVEKQGLTHVVGWAPHGRCFLVRNKQEFVSRILASWFRQSKFASFQRQLNLYGFKRITTGPDKGGYYHELFLRSKVFLCNRIERVKIKGSKPGRIKAYADAEPDFYKMKPMPSEDGAPAPGAIADRGNSPPPVQASDRNTALIDPSTRRGLSFLSEQPQPMPMKRNSPSPAAEEEKQGPNGSPFPQAPETSYFSILGDRDSSNYYSMLQAGFKDSEDNPSAIQRSTNIHPLLHSSARSSLTSLRENSQGIFGNVLARSEHSTTSMPPHTEQTSTGLTQSQNQNQVSRTGPLNSLYEEAQMPTMPSLSISNQLALSQSLPTAQALALEDLFDHNDSIFPTPIVQHQGHGIPVPLALSQQQVQGQLQLQHLMAAANPDANATRRTELEDGSIDFDWSIFGESFNNDRGDGRHQGA